MKHLDLSTPLATHLAALAEPLRLRILRILEKEELSVGEVGRVVQLPQSTVSRHLRVLSDAGWTVRRNEGTATLYQVVPSELPAPCQALWIAVRNSLSGDVLSTELSHDDQRLISVLAERREDSRAFFGRVAGQWDAVREELFGRAFTPLALLNLLPSDAVAADVGCGTGNVAELLSPVVGRVIAVDQSEPMLDAARARLAGRENIEFRTGRFERLPLEDGEADIAVCSLVLHHLESPEAAIREMKRVLRPGGTALVVDMIEHDRATYRHTMGHRWLGFSRERMMNAFGAAGLMDVRYSPMPSDTTARGPGLFVCTGRAGGAAGAKGVEN